MSGSKRIAKFAASTNAHDRYLFPFFVLPLPLRLPLESFSLFTHRQYEAKFPTLENLLISPVSSMIVSAREGQSGTLLTSWTNSASREYARARHEVLTYFALPHPPTE